MKRRKEEVAEETKRRRKEEKSRGKTVREMEGKAEKGRRKK